MAERLLDSRVALITGAGRGIGRSIALVLAENGAAVSLAARTASELRAVGTEIAANDGEAAVFPADIAAETDVVALVRGTVARFGRLDILVNNAGVGIYGPLAEFATSDWDRLMAVNARGPFLLCREALPHLRQQKESYIVNIASVVAVKGYPNQAAYSASKHALLGMTKALAKEVQADGVRVHAICPGGVDTELAGQARPDLDRSILIRPEEVAEVVLFLVTRHGNAVIDEVHVRRATATPWA